MGNYGSQQARGPSSPQPLSSQSPSSSLSYEGEYRANTMSLVSGARAHGLAGNCTDEEGLGAWKAAPGRKDTRDTVVARVKPAVTPTMAGGGQVREQR